MKYKGLEGLGLKGGSTWGSERRKGRSREIWVLVIYLGCWSLIWVLVPFNLGSCRSGVQSSFSPEVRIQSSRPDWLLCLGKERGIIFITLAVGTPDGGLLIILRGGRKRKVICPSCDLMFRVVLRSFALLNDLSANVRWLFYEVLQGWLHH